MGKPTFKDGRKFTFTKITIEGEFRGSINKGFEVSSDGNIAKVGFIYAKITSKEVVETSLNPDNALDKVLLQWNVEEDMIEELLRRVK